jgi:hypothetical protein
VRTHSDSSHPRTGLAGASPCPFCTCPFDRSPRTSFKIPHQTVRNPLHVSSRCAKQAHAFVKLIGRVRTALGQLLKLRPIIPSSPAIRSSSHRSIESSSLRLRHHARNFEEYEMADFGSEIDMASSDLS